ncbi:MAG: hypothetical protein ABWY93_04810 [Mycobacterium sp.]
MPDSPPATNAMTVRLDSRGRVNLAPFRPDSDTFIVSKAENGTIFLVPALIVPLKQVGELLALQSEALEQAQRDAEQPAPQDQVIEPGDQVTASEPLGSLITSVEQ